MRNKYTTFDKKSIIKDLKQSSVIKYHLIEVVRRLGLFVLCLVINLTCYAVDIDRNNDCKHDLISFLVVAGDTISNLNSGDTIVLIENKFDFIEFNLVPNNKDSAELHNFYLEGFEEKNNNWTYKNCVTYSKLNIGNYKFTIKSPGVTQIIHVSVKASNNRYLISTLILLGVIICTFIVLKLSLVQSLNKRVNSLKKDSIAPLLKKYLNKSSDDSIDNRKLSHRASVKYEKATVLFADIQGFTKIVEHMNPETLIDELDRFFVHFDEVAEKYKIEKIKTIGDAYMCAGGLPEKNRTNPIEVVLAAIEMQQFMQETGMNAQKIGKDFWELRIGIHTGSVISGVIGRKKLSFDIWGILLTLQAEWNLPVLLGK